MSRNLYCFKKRPFDKLRVTALKKIESVLAHLLRPSEPLIIGVSGGPDSVALLDALGQLGYRPHVAHLNHKLRGAESDADAEFVRQLAGKHGLPMTIASQLVTPDEDACRQARLAFFERVAKATGVHTLALAHTADDQVETFLLRLLRGAGTTGLAGIWSDRQMAGLRVIRPMLAVSRGEVLKYLSAYGLKYRVDASNADRRFLRNRIRHELLPLLERDYNPAIRDVLRRTAEILRAESATDPIAAERRAIRAGLGESVNFAQVEALRSLAMGDEVSLAGGVTVYRDYDGLKIGRHAPLVHGQWALKIAGETVIAELNARFVGECADLSALSVEKKRQSGDKPSSTRRGCCAAIPHSKRENFDADALGPAPFVRTWQDGDRFQPLGMSGEKKLQDFFVDEKVPRRQRARVPLLCATDGRIAWVAGYRIAEPFKVTKQTSRVLVIRIED